MSLDREPGILRLQPWKRGKPILASQLNVLREGVLSALTQGNTGFAGAYVDRDGVYVRNHLAAAVPEDVAWPVARFKIQSIENDWLVCRTWDGTVLGDDDYIVVKPESLRHDIIFYPWIDTLLTVDTQEITVEDTNNDLTEVWKVTPPYWVGGEVVAVQVGPVGIIDVPGQGQQTAATIQIRYDDDDIQVTFTDEWALLQGMVVDVRWTGGLRSGMQVTSNGKFWARIRYGHGDACPGIGTALTIELASWDWLDINKDARAWAVEYAV